jgi:molybdopterin-guanine dinucleotide biosynthesis protein A
MSRILSYDAAVTSAAILAGGRAERMGGRPKGLALVGGRRIVDRQGAALREVAGEVLLVVGDPSPYAGVDGVRVVLDHHPGRGPLAGIHAALWAAASDDVLIVGCDLPLLDRATLERVRDHAPGAQVVVPRLEGRPQALHARWSRSVRGVVEERLKAGELRLLDLLNQLQTVFLDEDALPATAKIGLTNVNTPADLARAEELLRQQGGA